MKDIIRHILKENKKERFLKVVIDDIINNTIINNIFADVFRVVLPFDNMEFHFNGSSQVPIGFVDTPTKLFYEYCKQRYNITNEEIQFVWGKYTDRIESIVRRKPLTESIEDKRERFLQFIIDDLISKTKITDDDGLKIKFNFLNKYINNKNPIPVNFIYKPSVERQIIDYFSFYCKDVYGLSSSDIEYVWLEYKNIVKDKINSK